MRRVVLALFGEAFLFTGLIFWLGSGEAGAATGRGSLGVFVGVLCVGFPSLYYCCQRGLWQVLRFVLLGALAGLLCVLPFLSGRYHFSYLLLMFVLAGAGMGLLFWIAGIWGNRELTCPKSFCLPCGTAYKFARNALRGQSK